MRYFQFSGRGRQMSVQIKIIAILIPRKIRHNNTTPKITGLVQSRKKIVNLWGGAYKLQSLVRQCQCWFQSEIEYEQFMSSSYYCKLNLLIFPT